MCVTEEYGTLVKRAVQSALYKCHFAVENEDALQIGWEMLLIALRDRDDSKPFRPYASMRVYGAVIDASRKFTRKKTENGVQTRMSAKHKELDVLSPDAIDALAGPAPQTDFCNSFDNLVSQIADPTGRLVVTLRYKYGVEMKDIGASYGHPAMYAEGKFLSAIKDLRAKVDHQDFCAN